MVWTFQRQNLLQNDFEKFIFFYPEIFPAVCSVRKFRESENGVSGSDKSIGNNGVEMDY